MPVVLVRALILRFIEGMCVGDNRTIGQPVGMEVECVGDGVSGDGKHQEKRYEPDGNFFHDQNNPAKIVIFRVELN